ncbi:MAG: ATP-binding cassette domain-containing protein [Lachnospiraceae bacterium]|nr:ATP-binding cassette domain-containing protein [Lachnospiraceae bacterium]
MKLSFLNATGLTKNFKGEIAVNRISISIENNSVHGLLGPNGAGKSTIVKMITVKPMVSSIK